MVPDAFFLAPDLLDKVEDVFKQLKRFADFTNFTIDDFEYKSNILTIKMK